MVTQLKNLNFDKIKQKMLNKTEIVTKLKNWNCDTTLQVEIVTQVKNSNCDTSKNQICDNTQKLQL